MLHQSVQSNKKEIEGIIEQYGDILFRICLVILCEAYDAEDAVQETFIKYLTKSSAFSNPEQEKAWLLKAVTNCCKNMKRFNFKRQYLKISELQLYIKDTNSNDLLEALMSLPERYKTVLLLYYVEEYKIDEVASMLRTSYFLADRRLQRGRELIPERIYKEKWMMDFNNIKSAVNSIQMTQVMKYRIIENCCKAKLKKKYFLILKDRLQ